MHKSYKVKIVCCNCGKLIRIEEWAQENEPVSETSHGVCKSCISSYKVTKLTELKG